MIILDVSSPCVCERTLLYGRKQELTGFEGYNYKEKLQGDPPQQSVHNTFQHVHLR